MTALDRRIVTAGLAITVATLAEVFADHYRGTPTASICPGCGHHFPDDDATGDCPTTALVRPLLLRRHHENQAATKRLTPDQFDNLRRATKPTRAPRTSRQAPTPALFNLTPSRPTGGTP